MHFHCKILDTSHPWLHISPSKNEMHCSEQNLDLNEVGSSRIFIHLNRVFGNTNWMKIFRNSCVYHLLRQFSDHAPLQINLVLSTLSP